MLEDSSVHNKDTFKRNVPIATNENVPLSELGHSTCRRKSIPRRKIEQLAIEKYRTTGEGIVFTETYVKEYRSTCSYMKATRCICFQSKVLIPTGTRTS